MLGRVVEVGGGSILRVAHLIVVQVVPLWRSAGLKFNSFGGAPLRTPLLVIFTPVQLFLVEEGVSGAHLHRTVVLS